MSTLERKRILRLPAVLARTGLGRSTVYLWMGRGEFPQRHKLGVRAVGWLESEIDSWIAECLEAGDETDAG